MDNRWWVNVTNEGRTRRHPFVERDNAYKFAQDCRDAGMTATVQVPRNADVRRCENNGCRDCGGPLSLSCPRDRNEYAAGAEALSARAERIADARREAV